MAHVNAPRPRYRFLFGLLFSGLPRRFIAGRFRDLPPGGADQSISYPIGKAGPRQRGGLADEFLMLGNKTNVQGG